jgi:hypothetical protein
MGYTDVILVLIGVFVLDAFWGGHLGSEGGLLGVWGFVGEGFGLLRVH